MDEGADKQRQAEMSNIWAWVCLSLHSNWEVNSLRNANKTSVFREKSTEVIEMLNYLLLACDLVLLSPTAQGLQVSHLYRATFL